MASDPPPSSLSTDNEKIARSAGLAGVATLTSRILGLVREQVLAAAFGAGNEMDAFVVAFRIPNLVRDLFAEGAMSAAFVPTFTRQLTLRGKADAWRLGNSVINGLILVTGAIVLLAMVFATPVVRMYAGEFAAVPGKLELTTRLTRLLLPFLTLAAIAAAIMGMLNSLRHYFIPALAPATFNIATIVCIVTLAPLMPSIGQPRIMVVAIAAIVGGLGQIAVQWPLLRREGFRYAPVLDFRDPGFRRVLLLMGPGTIGLAATQLNLLVTTILAAREGPGAVSWLSYAFRVMYLPIGLFGVSIATAVLPAVARHAAVNDLRAMSRTVAHGIALMLVMNLPASIGLFVLSTETVRLLFERGQFLPADTVATAQAVRYYAIGLIGYSATRIASPIFYALGRSRVAVMLSSVSVAFNLVLSVILVRVVGFSGLALATALTAILSGVVSLLLLRRHLGHLEGRRLLATSGKAIAASAIMAAAVKLTLTATLAVSSDAGALHQAIRLITSIGAGLIALVLAARVLRIAEAQEFLAEARRKLWGGA
jgi:putative peptidoglycan lipid II flippase